MRDESNRLIQNMERRRRAEREQDRQDLDAMQSNAEYTRNMEEANFKTRIYNEQQKNKQELANIASNAKDDQASFEVLSSIAQFSGTLAKGLAQEANRQTKRNIAQAQIADLGIDSLVAQHDARIAQTNGSIQLNAEIRENAARNGEDPLETTTNHVANPAIVGAARQVYENRRALALYNTLMDRASLTEEGLAASNDMDLQRDLQNRIKEDVLITMGNPKAAYLAEAFSAIDKGNDQRLQNVRASQLKIVKAEAREQIKVLYSSGNLEDAAKAWNQNESVFGYADALDKLDEAIKNAPTEEIAKMLLSLPISRDGKGRTYAEDRKDRAVPAYAAFSKKQRELEKAEDEQNKLELLELVDNNMPAILADFQRAPHDTMALWVENSAKLYGGQQPPAVIKNLYSQTLRNNKQDEATGIELLASRDMLDKGYVNSITDSDNLKLAKRLYEEQQIRKYGDRYPVVEDAIDEISAKLAEFSSQFAGDTDTQTEINKIDVAKWFEKDLKATGNALVSINKAQDLLADAHTNNPNNPFAYTDTAAGRVYRHLGKVDPELAQKSSYLARVSKNRSVGEIASQPYLLMNADQVREASFRSSRNLPMEVTPEIMQTRDMFGGDLTYSELINEQIDAHNKVTGENVPLITQTPAVKLMDNLPLASAKLFQSGMKNGSKAQMDRALTPLTGNLGYTRQQKKTINGFMDMAVSAGAKFPELVAAQVILESAMGTKESGANNWVGAKADEKEEGTLRETTEVIDGKEVRTVAKFKNYESPQAGINELVTRWHKDYQDYKGVNNASSLEEAAMMLQQQNYATDPLYAKKLIQIANRLR
jgi:flagellar protein FlgJ